MDADTQSVTPVTDASVRRKPQGYWMLRRGYAALGTGKQFPVLPKTLRDVLGVVREWHA